jgi:hypothetical protein
VNRTRKFSSILSLSSLVFLATQSYAQWSTDPSNNLIVGYGLLPELASDSAGGCYITYEQNLSYPRHLILERLNRYGYKPWGSGKQITGLLPEQSSAKVVEDGSNGVIVSFQDIEITGGPGNLQFTELLRVQRVDSNGNSLWGVNGVRVSFSDTQQSSQAIVSDGSGGCIVAWRQSDSILAQWIDSAGVRAWGDSGMTVVANTQYSPALIKTEVNRFIVAYGASMKKLDIEGGILWGGQSVNVGFGTRSIISHDNGDLIVYDAVGNSSNIVYVTQKFDSLGNWSWQAPYVVIAESTLFSVFGYPLIKTTANMVILAWEKQTNSVTHIYCQKLSFDGVIQWSNGGVKVSGMSSTDNLIIGAIPSIDGSAIITWNDLRGGLYSQRLNALGQQIWDSSDVVVSQPALSYEKVVVDGSGGCIIVGTREDFSIRVQQLSRKGNLGEIITSIDYDRPELPQHVYLYQNYPNPFNPTTTIRYDLPSSTWVKLEIFDQLGRVVQVLTDAIQQPGSYEVNFKAESLSSGIYYYRLFTPEKIRVRKLTILK